MYNPKFRPQPYGPVTVPTPGTPVSLISTLIANGLCQNGDAVTVNKVEVQALPGNTGSVYLGVVGMNKATGANVIAVLKAGQDWGITNNVSVNTYDLETYVVDADVAGDGVLGSSDAN